MPSRFIDVVYQLKDKFTGQVRKITGGYRKMGDEAEKSASRTSAAFGRSRRAVSGLAASVGKLAGVLGVGLGFGAAASEVKRFTADADRLAKVATKLGFSAEDLQRVGFAAERNGIGFDTMAVAMQRATRRIAEAASTGKGEAAPALDALGLSAKQLSELNLEDRMALLADAFAGISDQGERVRLAFKLFDTEGVDMVRVLQDGSVAFRSLTDEAGKFAEILSTEATQAAEELDDRMKALSDRFDKLTLPIKTGIVDGLNNVLASTGTYLSEQERITAELNKAYEDRYELLQRIATLERGGERDISHFAQNLAEVDATIRALQDEGIALAKLTTVRQEEAAANIETIKARKELTAARETAVKSLEQQTKDTSDALRKETSEWEQAKRAQLAIVKEFDELVAGAQRTGDEDVTGLDVQLKRLEAVRALAAGDADAAIKAAQAGGEMLEKLKTQGEQSGYVLSFLAKQLREVAIEAANKQAGKELIDVNDAKAAKERIESELETRKAVKLEVSDDSLNAMGRRVEETTRQAASQGLRSAFDDFQPGVDLTPAINDAVRKRGTK